MRKKGKAEIKGTACFRKAGCAALLAAAVLSLSGCGAGSSSASMTMAETAAAAYDVAAKAGGWGGDRLAAVPQAMNEMAEMEADPAEDAGSSGSIGQGSGESVTPSYETGRKLIRNVNMCVETEDFDQLVQAVNAKISELGGYAEQSDISGNSLDYRGQPIPRYASITARIPSSHLNDFVSSVEGNGNVTSKSETTTDVTLKYSDTQSRKKSLEIEQERIWALLEKADSLDSVIALEQRLSEIRYELEAMESQLRLYDNQVDYSTVYLTVSEVSEYTPMEPEPVSEKIRKGLADNLEAMGELITNLTVLFLVTSPFWLPAVVIILVAVWFVRRRRRTKRSGKVAERQRKAETERQQREDGAKQQSTEDEKQ